MPLLDVKVWLQDFVTSSEEDENENTEEGTGEKKIKKKCMSIKEKKWQAKCLSTPDLPCLITKKETS